MKAADLVSAGLVTIFGLVLLFVVIPAWVPQHPEGGYGMGARVMPNVMAATLTLFGAAFLVSRLFGRFSAGSDGEPAPISRANWFFLAGVAAFLALLTAVFTWGGFLAAGPLTVAGFMLAMDERRPLAIVATSAIATGAIWLFFWQLLRFPLP